ncbi:hypothetical protein [Nocardia inohanensis]|uniref:hypothetical protein n=1 Tax=Nocardia inohanensis TaxID=209246 RepID=UPI00082AA1FC|nr:hypothetical protein [Nocardia inohanensis]
MSEEEQRVHEESAEQDDARQMIPEPEIEDKHREKAHEMAESYKDERPLTVMPGTDGMVSGTAVTDWVDDQGEPIFDREN